MRGRSAVLFLLIVSCLGRAPFVHGQSLGDVARQEEERRKNVKDAGKVYTNKDLKELPPAPTPPPSADSSQSAKPASDDKASDKNADKGTAAPKEDSKDKEPAKDQTYWNARMKALQ